MFHGASCTRLRRVTTNALIINFTGMRFRNRRCRGAVLDKEGDTSILKTREATYVNGKLVLSSYLDKYPFPLYILLNHIEALPETLADALRQWFELLQRQTAR